MEAKSNFSVSSGSILGDACSNGSDFDDCGDRDGAFDDCGDHDGVFGDCGGDCDGAFDNHDVLDRDDCDSTVSGDDESSDVHGGVLDDDALVLVNQMFSPIRVRCLRVGDMSCGALRSGVSWRVGVSYSGVLRSGVSWRVGVAYSGVLRSGVSWRVGVLSYGDCVMEWGGIMNFMDFLGCWNTVRGKWECWNYYVCIPRTIWSSPNTVSGTFGKSE